MQDRDVANVATPKPQTPQTSWLEKNQDITRQSQDFVRNLGGNIAEGATDLYEGAKELGSDVYQGAQDLYSDFNKPDTRTQAEKWRDSEEIAQSIRTGITDTASSAWDMTEQGANMFVESAKAFGGDAKGVYDAINNYYTKYIDSPKEAREKGAELGQTLNIASENMNESVAGDLLALNQIVDEPIEFIKQVIDMGAGAIAEYGVDGLLGEGTIKSFDEKFPALANFNKKIDKALGF